MAHDQMPVLAQLRTRFERERPLDGVALAACLHVTAETANLVRTLGQEELVWLCARPTRCPSRTTSRAALVAVDGTEVRASHGEDLASYSRHVEALLEGDPHVTLDDGADLLVGAHERGGAMLEGLIGGTEETATGLVRLRRLETREGSPAPSSPSTKPAPSARSTTVMGRASPRWTASFAPATCCLRVIPWWWSDTAGRAGHRRTRAGRRLRTW